MLLSWCWLILPGVSPQVTRVKLQITSSFGLSVYTKGIQSDVAIENGLNAHFICFMTGTQTTKDQIYHFIRLNDVFLTYAANLWADGEFKEPESDTHASFESGFRNNSIVQNNNNYSFFNNYQNTPSFLAPLYTFCVFWTSTIVVVFHTAPGGSRGEVSDPALLVSSDSPSSCHAFECPSPSLRTVV